ncbi:MAG: polysaccharide biosynthesis protein [Ruminococcaceae bacterium]|nr:polysaccharide biosynthesis protein [Oscillospiraceae bacterium]
MQSRLTMTMRNAFWSYFSMIVSLVIQFVSHTVFVYSLGERYLGVNGLFANILGILSFTELGIGTAINFSLYKPVANGDKEKIKAYMHYYKWAYRIIALIITVIGLALFPFLDVLVKDPGDIGDIRVYFLLFLFNTVTSYFVSYKFSLVNAEQKNYIYTNINLIMNFTKVIAQIIALLLFSNYLVYLLIGTFVGLVQKIFVSLYFNKLYPYLKEKNVEKLDKESKKTLVDKIKALFVHKVGDVCVHQTDNIIVSSFISIKMVGLISNYNLLINTVSSYINVLFTSVTGSLGNLVATESKEHQYSVFCTYRFIAFWFYGFTAIALLTLSTPFITLWLGKEMVVDEIVITLIIINYYMIGHRICLNNIKSAGGVFERDKYVALVQAVVNLVFSIGLVYVIGVAGVYVGTIIQGLVSTIIKPIVSYKPLFGISSKYYFIDAVKYAVVVVVAGALCMLLRYVIMPEVTILRFIAIAFIVVVIPNALFWLCFRKRAEYQYVKGVIVNKLFKRRKAKA